MEVKQISISKIKATNNYRTAYGDVPRLMASMKNKGLVNPIIVRKNGTGYILIGGHRRLNAAKKLGWKRIDVQVRSEFGADEVLLNVDDNLNRENPPLSEIGRSIFDLKNKYKMTTQEIAARLGVPNIKVTDYLSLYLNVPKEFQKKVVSSITPGRPVPRGKISSHSAGVVVSAARAGDITNKSAKAIIKGVIDGEIAPRSVTDTISLVKSGKTVAQAKKSKRVTRTVSVHVVFSASEYEVLSRRFKGHKGLLAHMRKVLKKDGHLVRGIIN